VRRWRGIAAAVALCCAASASVARADALVTLTDAELFKRAQADVARLPVTELEALSNVIATCGAVTLGQRQQHYECEREVNRYWARYNRDRASIGGLFAGFDNAMNPTPPMMSVYKRMTTDLITLTRSINARFRQLEKP
jgi:hypothetical protein